MLKYLGSGTIWNRHIKKHGIEYVETVWFCLFYDKEDCKEFAEGFSEQEKIVESKVWTNLRPENGINGGGAKGEGKAGNTKNHPPKTDKQRKHLAEIRIGSKQSAETIAKKIKKQTGQKRSDKTKKNMHKPKWSNINYFGTTEKCTCPQCGQVGGVKIMPRYHFDNCKHRVLNKELLLWL